MNDEPRVLFPVIEAVLRVVLLGEGRGRLSSVSHAYGRVQATGAVWADTPSPKSEPLQPLGVSRSCLIAGRVVLLLPCLAHWRIARDCARGGWAVRWAEILPKKCAKNAHSEQRLLSNRVVIGFSFRTIYVELIPR